MGKKKIKGFKRTKFSFCRKNAWEDWGTGEYKMNMAKEMILDRSYHSESQYCIQWIYTSFPLSKIILAVCKWFSCRVKRAEIARALDHIRKPSTVPWLDLLINLTEWQDTGKWLRMPLITMQQSVTWASKWVLHCGVICVQQPCSYLLDNMQSGLASLLILS